MNFCSQCGNSVMLHVPPGDDRPRFICDVCATIHYQNPKMVVGAVPVMDGKILLCKRAIEPRRDTWTIPAGWLENGETVAAGAGREAEEEAGAKIEDLQPYVLVDLPFIHQVYLIFRARLLNGDFHAGAESLEVKLFALEEIPWDNLAFTAVYETLRFFGNDLKKGNFPFRILELSDPPSPQSSVNWTGSEGAGSRLIW